MRPEHTDCVRCGFQIKVASDGPVPRYCSADCRRSASYKRSRQDGRYDAGLAAQRQRTKERQADAARPCPYCGAPMTHPRRKQCGSLECKRAAKAEWQRNFQQRYRAEHGEYYSRRYDRGRPRQCMITCQHCGERSVVTKAGAKYCSHACFYDARYGEQRPRERVRDTARVKRYRRAAARLEEAASGVRGKGVWTSGACSSCGTAFVRHSFGTPVAYCSVRCRRRERNALRRALQHDLQAGLVSRIGIYQRDGWTCHICGDPVDRDAVVPDLAAPVLDHVVPLARRGRHEEGNLKTAHFYCNSVKRDLVEGWSAAS